MDKTFPSLYHRGSKGELRIWTVSTEGNMVKTEYGIVGGAMQNSSYKCYAKNVGKKNATTDETQAHADALSDWNYKIERKYSLTPEGTEKPLIQPMLAKDKTDKIKYPCYGQPKLDGVRCMSFWNEEDRIIPLSRGNKEWLTVGHIVNELNSLLGKDSMFDGELYIHGMRFQAITKLVGSIKPETCTLEYHIYDMPSVDGDDTLPFCDRLEGMKTLSLASNGLVKMVETVVLNSWEEVKAYETKCVEAGYEGAIVRNADGKYRFGYRSSDLIKIKSFQDSEFKVIDCREGEGKMEGSAVFICQNDINDETFDVIVACSMEERKEMFDNMNDYIGRILTVKHFGRTDKGLPRIATGKAFRLAEDLGV